MGTACRQTSRSCGRLGPENAESNQNFHFCPNKSLASANAATRQIYRLPRAYSLGTSASTTKTISSIHGHDLAQSQQRTAPWLQTSRSGCVGAQWVHVETLYRLRRLDGSEAESTLHFAGLNAADPAAGAG